MMILRVSKMKYPYIGKLITGDLTVLFYSNMTGVVVRAGDSWEVGYFGNVWYERGFKNITREYLTDIKVKIESQEHLEFLYKIAENADFEVSGCIAFSSAHTHFAVIDLDANEINSDCLIFGELKDAIIPLPSKQDDRSIEEDAKYSAHFVEGDSYDELCEGMKDMENEEWPKVGDEVALRYRFDSKGIHITGKLEFISHRHLIVDDCHKLRSEYDIEKPPTPEEVLAELIDESLYATVDMDDILKIAKVIIEGDIEGVKYEK